MRKVLLIIVCGLLFLGASQFTVPESDLTLGQAEQAIRNKLQLHYPELSDEELERFTQVALARYRALQRDLQRLRKMCEKERNPELCVEHLRHQRAIEGIRRESR